MSRRTTWAKCFFERRSPRQGSHPVHAAKVANYVEQKSISVPDFALFQFSYVLWLFLPSFRVEIHDEAFLCFET